MRRVLRTCGVGGNASTWSLRSPSFFVPSLAGQLRFPMEERRTLGRWGVSSGMSVRYNRARCVTKLLREYGIEKQRHQHGFKPAGAFKLPGRPALLPAASPSASPGRGGTGASPALEQKCEEVDSAVAVHLVLNSSIKILHRHSAEEPTRIACSFWRGQSCRSVVAVVGPPRQYVDEAYVPCGTCWSRASADIPKWQGEESSSASGGPSLRGTRDPPSSDGSASANSSAAR